MKNPNSLHVFNIIVFIFIILINFSCESTNNDLPNETKVTVKDLDGNVYHTIKIGNQTWMIENLKVTKYRNGDPINNIVSNTDWPKQSIGAWCDYGNNTYNGIVYGKIYNWYAVNDVRKIAPEGWHVASIKEWEILRDYLINNGFNKEGNTIGKSLASTIGWKASTDIGVPGNNPATNNTSGFSAQPCGMRSGDDGKFYDEGVFSEFWTSTKSTIYEGSAYSILLGGWYINMVVSDDTQMQRGYYIRCVKD